MEMYLNKEIIQPYREQIVNRIREKHFRQNECYNGRLFLISTTYPGYWLEHVFDSIVWAKLYPEDSDLASSQVRLFLKNQREDGRIPCCIFDNEIMNSIPGLAKVYTGQDVCPPGFTTKYSQLQECVSIASLCLEAWEINQSEDLEWYYNCCSKWDEWLCNNRMTRNKGLVETFCGFDTGHDNSGRFAGMKYKTDACRIASEFSDGYPVDCDVAPLISPDVNAVFYGSRTALSKMADILGKKEEANMWRNKAADVKSRLIETCFDPESCFFYDVDKHDQKIYVKSISITTLFCEHLLDNEMADEIYTRYLSNPKEFATPYPFPGTSISDPAWQQNSKREFLGVLFARQCCITYYSLDGILWKERGNAADYAKMGFRLVSTWDSTFWTRITSSYRRTFYMFRMVFDYNDVLIILDENARN